MDLRLVEPFPFWAWPIVWSWLEPIRDQVGDDSSPKTAEQFVEYGVACLQRCRTFAVMLDGQISGAIVFEPTNPVTRTVHLMFARRSCGTGSGGAEYRHEPGPLAAMGSSCLQSTGMRILTLCLFVLACALLAPAQALPVDFVAAGVTYNQQNSPGVSGTGIYAHQLAATTGTYSFTAVDITSKTLKPFVTEVATTTGIAQRVYTFGSIPVFGVVSFGGAAAGSNAGLAYSAGGMFTVPLGKKGWTLAPGFRALKTALGEWQYLPTLSFGYGK